MSCLLPSLKLECEKLASEKTEMQRHYVMVSGPAGQGSAGQGLALSGNTWTANLNSVCHSGVGPRSSRGLVVPLCNMGWLGFQVFLPGPSQLLRTMREGCPLPSWASLRVQGLWALPPAPPPWREWRGGPSFPLGGPRGWDNLCPAVIPQPGGSWKTQSHPVQAWTSVSAVDIPARLFLCSTTRCPMDSTWKCISR